MRITPSGPRRMLVVGIVGALALAPVVGTGCVKAWLFRRLPAPLLPEAPPPEGLASVSAETCGACHPDIYAEWRGSQMAKSWTDPVFRADWDDNHQLYACLYCHTPLVEQRPTVVTGLSSLTPITGEGMPNPAFSEALREEGVTCVTCHLREGAIVGPIDGVTAPHPVRIDPAFGSPELCAQCHQVGAPPLSDLERPIADTHGEWEAWKDTTGRTEACVDCHMPPVTRPVATNGPVREGRRHTWGGGWDAEMVRGAIDVSVEGATVVLTNRAGHRFPTAEPARALAVTMAFSRDGVAIGSETRWLERRVKAPRLVDEGDTTLLPGETRRLSFDAGVATEARLTVVYDRLKHLPDTKAVAPGDPELVLVDRVVPLGGATIRSAGQRP